MAQMNHCEQPTKLATRTLINTEQHSKLSRAEWQQTTKPHM